MKTSGPTRFWVPLLGLLCASAVGGTAREQAAAQPPASPPRTLDTVAVEFYAVSSDGQPVADLKPQEVQVRVDGRQRPLKWLEWIPVAAAPTADGAAAPAVPLLPPPFGSNAAVDAGRSFVIAIEDDSFRPGRERPLRAAVDRFLDALSPRDRVGVVTMPYGGWKSGLTTDHAKVRDALSKVSGQGSSTETGQDMACRTRRTLESLTGLVAGLSAGEGSTTVMFFSSGMAGPRRDAEVTKAPGRCEITTDVFAQLGQAAGAGRATFYMIQPEDLMLKPGANQTENIAGTGFTGSDNPLEGIEHLAGVTGAHRLHLAATGDNTLVRVARETSAYYALGFEPNSGDRNGSSRMLDVRVARAGVVVRARPNITIPRVDNRGETKPQPVAPRAMLREPKVFRDLPLRAIGYVSSNPDDSRLKILTVVEPIDPTLKLAAVSTGLYDTDGRLVAQWTAEPKNLDGIPVVGAMAAKPGTYRMRAAATDTAGRSGTADYEVVAELVSAGPLQLSALVLGLSRSGGFVPKLQFSTEPVALAYFEIYGKPLSVPVSVSAELSGSVNGPALVTTPAAIKPVPGEDRFIATAAIPIGSLPPGDYIVRATVGVQGQPAGRVMRTLRKTLR